VHTVECFWVFIVFKKGPVAKHASSLGEFNARVGKAAACANNLSRHSDHKSFTIGSSDLDDICRLLNVRKGDDKFGMGCGGVIEPQPAATGLSVPLLPSKGFSQ